MDKFEQENLRRGRIKLEFGGIANQLGGAVGRLRDLLQSRRQEGVFLMFNEKSVGVALDNGEEIVQLVRQGERDVPVGIGPAVILAIFPAAGLQAAKPFFHPLIQDTT